MNKTELLKLLKNKNQFKLISEIENLTEDELSTISTQVSKINWDEFKIKNIEQTGQINPSKVITLSERAAIETELVELGLNSYKNGEVAVIMVAGGQGTRLGFSEPKGCFKIGAISKKSLYQIHSEKVLATSLKFGKQIPFLIMTSSATDLETKEFYSNNNFFGLAKEQVKIFKQGEVPSFDLEGNLLLSKQDCLLTNPDGHGGCFTALSESGLLSELEDSGIKHLIYIQVDNALAPIYDPFLIGLAVKENADVITKVVEKCSAEEKVGLLVSENGKDTIKEYINLPIEILKEETSKGKLKYFAGNTAMHYWNLNFLARKSREDYKLPLHASKKPLKVWNMKEAVEGHKYERFIFDLLPEANKSLGLEIDRCVEFAPLKNSSGSDSPETVNQLCSNLYRNWIEKSGISLHESIEIEISPLLAMDCLTLSGTLSFDAELRSKIENSTNRRLYLD